MADCETDSEGYYVALVDNYQSFIYNASAASEAPKTFSDLLDPKYKNKIQYSTPGQAGDGTAVMLQVIHAFGGKDAGFDYLQKPQDPNIRIFWPAGPDGKRSTFSLPYYVGLVKGAPHADAGKKLIEFLLTQEAQAQVSAIAQGLPVRQDVHPTDDNFKQLHAMMEGVEVWTPDWPQVLKDLKEDVARWHQVTGS